jgi:GT2 family glycosyltransferase
MKLINKVFKREKQKKRVRSCVDALTSDGAYGWVCDLTKPDLRFTVEAIVDGRCVAEAVADGYRIDIEKLGIGDGYCGFELFFPKECFDGCEHKIELRLKETGDFVTVNAIDILFPSSLKVHQAVGYFDGIDSSLVAKGWACIPDQLLPASIEVLVDEIVVAKGEARLVRPEIITSAHGEEKAGFSGFSIPIPPSAIIRLESSVGAMVNGKHLSGSPKLFCPADPVSIHIDVKNGKVNIELAGWPGDALSGELRVDGQAVGIIHLKVSTETARNKGHLLGNWSMPDAMLDGQQHIFTFEIHQGRHHVRSDAVVARYPDYKFHLDIVDFNRIEGWAFRLDSARPLLLEVFSNDRCVSKTLARNPRQDVSDVYKRSNPYCGFALTIEDEQYVSNASYCLMDAETGIALAEVSVAEPYTSLTEIAASLAHQGNVSNITRLHTLLAPLAMRAAAAPTFVVDAFPKRRVKEDAQGVDVVIPVYGGSMETVECIESVLAAENKNLRHVIIINDCSPDVQINDYLNALERRGLERVVIIHRTMNGGFSEAVNIGMIAAGDHDVILLNADTVVLDGWIDRIVSAADSDPWIGTVTPLSNNGEICNVPYMCKTIPVDSHNLAVAVDQAASKHNVGKIIDIPVGIGFCMFIRRKCINQIGLFDAALWGRGYGEEVDFCLKAAAHGWRNILAADTFVVHRGNISFGDEKLHRIIESAQKISQRYPFYNQLIQNFISADPVASVRRAINIALIEKVLPVRRILHISHYFGGGTEQYVQDMVALYQEAKFSAFILRFDVNGESELEIDTSKTSYAGFFGEKYIEKFKSCEINAIKDVIHELNIERIHIHAPFGMQPEFLEWLSNSFSFDVTVHDYAWICPRVTLTLPGGRYCGEPSAEQCAACVTIHKPHDALKRAIEGVHGDVVAYRQKYAALFDLADNVYAGARDVIDRLGRHGLGGKSKVVPHPASRDVSSVNASTFRACHNDHGTIRIAAIGAISDIKGYYQLLACAEIAVKKRLPLEFVVLGYTMNDLELGALPNVSILGKYDEQELDDLIAFHQPNLALFPFQWPETFSYTLSHCFRLGIWPVVTDIGAPAERIRESGIGTLYPLGTSADELVNILMDESAKAIRRLPPTFKMSYPETLAEYTQPPSST